MLRRNHAASGALVGLAVADPLAHSLGHPALSPLALAGDALVAAGFALLPDIDEPNSTVSRKLGAISRAASAATSRVAGGHRQATHSLLFAGVAFAGAELASRFVYGAPVVIWGALALSVALVIPGVRRRGLLALLLPIAAASAALHLETGAWWPAAHLVFARKISWVPFAAGIGLLCHLAGDALTASGVPFFWPWRRHFALPLLGRTGSKREVLLGAGLVVGLLALAFAVVAHPELAHLEHAAAAIRRTATSVGQALHEARRVRSGLAGLPSGPP